MLGPSSGARAEQREGNEETPMIISSDEELEGEDAEVTSAFSGELLQCSLSNYWNIPMF